MIISRDYIQKNWNKILFLLLSLVAIIVFLYTFRLAYKRYDNFEFGKFDLGNMSQIVWNTSQGHFMEVTDQFGSNMKRFGMSHVDWVLVLFSPIYWVYPNPMVLVFVQNIFIVSGFIPLYFLVKKFSKSSLIAFISGLIYLLYPAHGFLLSWSEYHGVAHVAPVLIWMYWYLDKYDFKLANSNRKIIFWLMYVFMLGGKEQVGFILGMFGLWVFLKNKKLGFMMFLIGMAYSFFSFLVIIPHYVPDRNSSVSAFIELTGREMHSGADVVGENFFLNRYTYLGSGYADILKNIISNPLLVFAKWGMEDKVENLNYMFAPLSYISLLVPFWLIALPDYLIAMMADVKGFLSIENQRVSMIISALFVTYALFIKLLYRYPLAKRYRLAYVFAIFSLILTVNTSINSANPLFTHGISFIENKIVRTVFSQSDMKADSGSLALGTVRKSRIPENTFECRTKVMDLINAYNPQSYSGPDALGGKASLRRMNALFPAGIDRTDMFVADLYDWKAYGSLDDVDPIRINRYVTNKILNTGQYSHIFSCDRMSVFIRDENLSMGLDAKPMPEQPIISTTMESRGNIVKITLVEAPTAEKPIAKYYIEKVSPKVGEDTVTYWIIENNNQEKVYSALDYKYWAGPNINNMNNEPIYIYYDFSQIFKTIGNGEYKVFYGYGSTSKAEESYIFDIQL